MAPETATRLSDWDNAPVHSASTSDDENDLTLLKAILDEVLDNNDDVDGAIADSSIITEFHEHAFRSGSHESPPTHLMDPVVTTRTIIFESSTGPRFERMAFVESIQLKADSKQLTTGPAFPDSTQLRVQKSSTPDANSSDWYSMLKPMLKKMLKWSRYSDARCNDVLTFFVSNMVQFLGPVPDLTSTHRWRSFINPDNTPLSLSLAWGAARPAPRTRLAIDIIPASTAYGYVYETCKRSIEFALALRQYTDDRNAVAITKLDLQPFYAVANHLFIPVLHKPKADEIVTDEIVTDLVSGPSLSFFGLDIEESETKVEAYFIPGLAVRLQDEDDLVTMSRTFMSLIPADASQRSTLGAFNAWREIVSSFSTLAEEDIPLPFMLSVDCVPRLDARYRVYIRCVSRSPEELQRLMSLDGRVELSPRHIQGVIDLWYMLRPSVDLLQSQSVLSAYGLCISFEFKQSSPLPTATVYFPVQQWVSNDLKIAHVIARWLEKYGHPEAAATYVDIASDIYAPRRLVEGSGFHTYVGVAPTEDGGCEATTYYNPSLFRQESRASFASGSTG